MQQTSQARLFHLDNVRSALVLLVVLHHLALVYGAFAPFYYQEPPFGEPAAFLASGVFVLFNQAWFMGALFLLAGYFTPGSLDRSGPAGFIKARLVRLGIPILAGIFLLEPLARVGFLLMPPELTGITAPPTWAAYPGLLGLGPLWFVALLLIFDCLAALWRAFRGNHPRRLSPDAAFPGYPAIAVFVALLAAASYAIRIPIPMGRELTLGVPFLNFPTIAYLPQYASFFVLGAIAGRRGWLSALPASAGVAGFVIAAVAAVFLFPLAISGEFLTLRFAETAPFTGRGTWESAVYAIWDSATAVGLSLGFVVFFRRFFDGGGPLSRLLSRHSYAVYIIHAPIIVYLAYWMRGIEIPAFAKFGLAAVIVIPVCFAAAWLLKKAPLASKVI